MLECDVMGVADAAERNRGEVDALFIAYRDFVEESLSSGRWPEAVRFRDGSMSSVSVRLAQAVLVELRALLCTDDRRYAEIRKQGGKFSQVALPAVAGYVAGVLGLSTGRGNSGA